VLYTHQKMKKSKTWQDGILRIRPGENKAILLDDKGQYLESMFVKSQVNSGDNLESERYLITVEEAKMNEKSCEDQRRKAEIVEVNRCSVKPGVLHSRHLSVGLKRKFTGFQGPRQVEKKVPTVDGEERMAILPISERSQDTFPSKFYITSPLFSTVYKKNAETNLSKDLHEDGGANNRDHATPSSVVSLPFLHTCNETEKKNSEQSTVKPESPLITGHIKSSSWPAGHGAVSQNIRSTAEIIALLKSNTTQICGEQATSEVTECPRFQALENVSSLYNLKSTTFSADSDKRLAQNIQHLPFTKEIIYDEKEQNVEVLLSSSEPCDKEITGQRHDKKANSLSQNLQGPCKTNSSLLSESTISRMSDSQFVSSCSASPVTFETHISRYREHLAINGLQSNSLIKSQSDLQLRQSSERVPSNLKLSEDVTLTENGIGEYVAQSTALRLNSCSKVMAHCKKEEIKHSAFDVETDGNHCMVKMPSHFCDKVVDAERTMENSSNCTKIEVKLLDRNNLKEINESLISIEAMNNERDLGGCAAHSINGISGTKSKHFDLFPGDTNVKCRPTTGMFDKTENISCIASCSIIATAERQTEEDVMQLGCTKSPDTDLNNFWGTESDYIKSSSPVLILSQNSESCWKGHSASEEAEMDETELENLESTNAPYEVGKGERIEMDYLKSMAMAENSSYLPDLVNNITLLRTLSQCSTALDSLQMMKENNNVLHE
ncbi:ZGRF1 protein, partial [Odontophorus gujanensis]|nr:ZGRF1 protein [Odontophorus gujanensis]